MDERSYGPVDDVKRRKLLSDHFKFYSEVPTLSPHQSSSPITHPPSSHYLKFDLKYDDERTHLRIFDLTLALAAIGIPIDDTIGDLFLDRFEDRSGGEGEKGHGGFIPLGDLVSEVYP